MSGGQPQEWFEAAWEDREERVYPSLFGNVPGGIYPLGFDTFEGMSAAERVDPCWLTYGVFECPPDEKRSSWLYVSSGLSNAWEASTPDPNSWSGLGCEFVLQSMEQARWALFLLQRMVAFEICLAHGRFPGRSVLELWDRIPLRAPIDGKSSRLDFLLVAPATGFEGTHSIPSGKFEFLSFLGITEDEASFAREYGGDRLYPLLLLLLQKGAAPVTCPQRGSVLE